MTKKSSEPIFKPVSRVNARKQNPVISVRLTPDLYEPFYKMCSTHGLSPNRLCLQCIEFALKHTKS